MHLNRSYWMWRKQLNWGVTKCLTTSVTCVLSILPPILNGSAIISQNSCVSYGSLDSIPDFSIIVASRYRNLQSLAKCSESGTISVATRELGFIEFYLCAFEINCANSAISSSEENGTCARITLPSPESFAAK